MLQVVWFKKDLRWTDHAPLVHAARSGPVLAVWMHEPAAWQQPDAAPRHLAFAHECLAELERWLVERGGSLWRPQADAIAVLQRIREAHGAFVLWSHEETGNAWSYARDRSVAAWCRSHGVLWNELPCNGVVRRLRDRDRWSQAWTERMEPSPLEAPEHLVFAEPIDRPALTGGVSLGSAPGAGASLDLDGPQRGGRLEAWALLSSFLAERGQHYRVAMSSPLSAATACSRVSAHLAWGTLSVRECAHALWRRRAELLSMAPAQRPAGLLESLQSFESRLHWHCHFIQKLESEPAIEFRNVNRGFDDLRNEGVLTAIESHRLAAWTAGRTGFPLIDACMRSLRATGWINFRMRAMLMSFASYQLWLHWRAPALHLAREFVDYEPGIHYPQAQMQSGVTGINTIRIYNPVKQSHDQDPDGTFIRRWIPELRGIGGAAVHEPWLLAGTALQAVGYPEPLVDLESATRLARDRVHAQRESAEARRASSAVYERHGSRHPQREGGPRRGVGARPREAGVQLDLLGDVGSI